MRTAHGSSSWICQAEYTGTSHAVRAHFDDFGVHLALQTLSGALAGICPYCSYVPMETRTRISCALQCWRGKSKHGWEGRNQRGRGQRVPSLGTISGVLKLPGSGREGRRQFQQPELACSIPAAQSGQEQGGSSTGMHSRQLVGVRSA